MPVFDAKLPINHEAVHALESRRDAEALKALTAIAAIDDQFLRRTAVEVIGRHPQGHELRACILSALGDPSAYVVRTACEVVARWRLSEAHDLVLPLLASASRATRQSAIRALGSIWVDADFPLVFSIFTTDSDIDIRRESAWVLQQQATSATWRTLFDAFCVDELARHRQWACELAENFSGPEIVPWLSPLLRDLDGHVRNAAARATGMVSGRSDG